MKRQRILAVVDRIEGQSVVLEVDGGGERIVPKASLPAAVEGAVLRVRLSPNGEPDWSTAVRDRDEETARRDQLGKRDDRLRRRDAGGDIDL
jgi:hypothetical protein